MPEVLCGFCGSKYPEECPEQHNCTFHRSIIEINPTPEARVLACKMAEKIKEKHLLNKETALEELKIIAFNI